MKMWQIALTCWLFGCTAANATQANADDAFADMDWVDVMQDLNTTMKVLKKSLLQQPQGELEQVAERAQRAAAQMRLGYGRLEDEQVPTFAKHARDAETWLVKIAIEAQQGHGDTAAELYRTGRGTYCVDCHDAVDAAQRAGR